MGSIYLFAVIKSSTRYFTEAATERGSHSWWEKACLQIWSNSWKNPVKNFMQGFIFILFGSSFSTYVTKLYPIRNRGVSRTTAKSKMEVFVKKVNGFQLLTFATKSFILDFAIVLDTTLRKELFPFLLSRQTDTSKYKRNWHSRLTSIFMLIFFNIDIF